MSEVIESPASLARRRLHKTEDEMDGDRQQGVNGTTSQGEKQPDEGSVIEEQIEQLTPTDDEEPRNPVAWLAPLFHLAMAVFYALLLYYGTTLSDKALKLMDTKLKIPQYGGRFKFLTHINLWVQLFTFILLFFTDLIPRSPFRKTMRNLSDIVVTAMAFPLAWFIVFAFWGIYAYDRQLVYPAVLDKIIPTWLNHFWHTTIGIFVLFEVMLVYHQFPKSGVAACISFAFNAAYISWVIWIYSQTKFWIYPIMAILPLPVLLLFFAACMFFSFGLFFLGRHVSILRWGPTIKINMNR